MTSSAPTLPHPYLINGLNHIPPPPIEDFISQFSSILPEGTSIPSSWGTTRFYDFSPKAPASSRRIIILHGGGTPAIGLAPLAHKLTSAGNHVVAYDMWGHGLSSTPLETHTPALMHAQLLELLSYLKWTTCNFVGFSIGGSIAATFVALHPHAADSLTLLSPAGLLRRSGWSWWTSLSLGGYLGFEWLRRSKIMSFINGGTNPQPRPDWKERLLKGEVDNVAVEKWERENHKGHVASVVSMYNYGGVFDQHGLYAVLAKTGVEVLVLVGSGDQVFSPEMVRRELGAVEWKGPIRVIEGATHGIAQSHVNEVAGLAEEFWNSLGRVIID